MIAGKDNFYRIKIILTNNEDNEEFTIETMKQIQLEESSRRATAPNSSYDNKNILMLREPYYINNDVIQKIREIAKGSTNTNNLFPSILGSKTSINRFTEFYDVIMSHKDKEVKINTIKFILEKFIGEYFKEISRPFIKKKTFNEKETKEPAYIFYKLINDTKADINLFIQTITNTDERTIYEKLIEWGDDFINNAEFITYLKAIYNNPSVQRYGEGAIAFKDNINAIFSKNSVDGANEFNNLSKYEYFLDKESIRYIFNIIESNNKARSETSTLGYPGRQEMSLNSKDSKKQILTDNFKYVFPNKTSIDQLGSGEEDLILLFYNILYVIKKIYLLDTTIIEVNGDKFFLKNLTLDKVNPFKRDTSRDGSTEYIATIRFNVDLTYINEIPILKINYIIDDLENNNLFKTSSFEPKNFSKNQTYSKYKSIYIYDDIEYDSIKNKIDTFFNTIKIQSIIKNKEELFYNDIVLNKLEKLHKELLGNKKDKKDKKDKNDAIITSNIKYFLKDILKLYNGKEFTYNNDTYFIYDTLITKDFHKPDKEALDTSDKSEKSDTNVPFYSIYQKQTHFHSNLKTHKIIKNLKLKKKSLITDMSNITVDFNIFYSDSPDIRIKARVYYIFIVFLCYKADENGKKPNIKDRIITESCSDRAKVLDKSFATLFYNKFKISENYLFNKISNLTRSKKVKPPTIGNAVKDDALKGDPIKGDPLKGDPIKGDPLKGDANPTRNLDIEVRGGKGRNYRTRKNYKVLRSAYNKI